MTSESHQPIHGGGPTKRSTDVMAAERLRDQVRGLPATKVEFERSLDDMLERFSDRPNDAGQDVLDLTALMTRKECAMVTGALARRAIDRAAKGR